MFYKDGIKLLERKVDALIEAVNMLAKDRFSYETNNMIKENEVLKKKNECIKERIKLIEEHENIKKELEEIEEMFKEVF